MKFDVQDIDGTKSQQYNVFERRLTDKLSFFDWKLSYQGSPEEFVFIHNKSTKLWCIISFIKLTISCSQINFNIFIILIVRLWVNYSFFNFAINLHHFQSVRVFLTMWVSAEPLPLDEGTVLFEEWLATRPQFTSLGIGFIELSEAKFTTESLNNRLEHKTNLPCFHLWTVSYQL